MSPKLTTCEDGDGAQDPFSPFYPSASVSPAPEELNWLGLQPRE